MVGGRDGKTSAGRTALPPRTDNRDPTGSDLWSQVVSRRPRRRRDHRARQPGRRRWPRAGQSGWQNRKTENADQTISIDRATVAALRRWREHQDGEREFFSADYHPGDYVFTFE